MKNIENQKIYQKLLVNPKIQLMKQYKQHGSTTTYEHSVHVCKVSYKIGKFLHLNTKQMKNLIVGSLLHDFYLYDWHDGRIRKDGIHAWTHPIKALNNAERYFKLNEIQKNMIRCHMFPLCLFHPPKYIESWIIIITDKYCSLVEYLNTYFKRRKI